MSRTSDPSNQGCEPGRALTPAEAKAEQADRDYTSCRNAVMRAMSNKVRGYRTCPVSVCRRARRCGVSSLDCLATIKRIPLSYDQQMGAIDEVYQDLLRRRRGVRKRRGSQ